MTIFKYGPWYRWFAWYPVHVIPFGWRWLVHVKRRRWGIDHQTYIGWEYALLNPPRPIPEEDN